jgi:hypothetical protein
MRKKGRSDTEKKIIYERETATVKDSNFGTWKIILWASSFYPEYYL